MQSKSYPQHKINEMNTSEIKKNWNEQEAKLKQKFATVTDNDLAFKEGKNEKMSGVLQVKLSKRKRKCIKLSKHCNEPNFTGIHGLITPLQSHLLYLVY